MRRGSVSEWSHLEQRGGDKKVWREFGTHCMVAPRTKRGRPSRPANILSTFPGTGV